MSDPTTPRPGRVNDLAANDVARAKAALRERSKKERKDIADQTNSAFWFAAYFASKEQRDAFLAAIRAADLLEDDQHVSGRKLAKLLGVELPPDPKQRHFKADRRFAALALPGPAESE